MIKSLKASINYVKMLIKKAVLVLYNCIRRGSFSFSTTYILHNFVLFLLNCHPNENKIDKNDASKWERRERAAVVVVAVVVNFMQCHLIYYFRVSSRWSGIPIQFINWILSTMLLINVSPFNSWRSQFSAPNFQNQDGLYPNMKALHDCKY